MIQFLIGLFLGILIALLAWKAQALSNSGAWAAAITGGLVFGLGGFAWATLLLIFFISSSALSRVFASRKATVNEKFSKGSRRDWGQVLANGGLGAVLVIMHAMLPGAAWPWIAFTGAMAAVNADTWATELGVLNTSPPRLISNGRFVERGTSGGISLLGTLAALGGAALVAVGALFFTPDRAFELVVAASLGGLLGSFFDSLLGATVQAIYYCPKDQKETERHPLHTCGTETVQIRGWQWMNNDVVNFACSAMGALSALGLWISLE